VTQELKESRVYKEKPGPLVQLELQEQLVRKVTQENKVRKVTQEPKATKVTREIPELKESRVYKVKLGLQVPKESKV
tara:strand:+ start:198 stop:428 length:231 start_codon:yes stop_codon:yes gene_type:complete